MNLLNHQIKDSNTFMKKKQLQDEFFNSFLQKATFFLIVIYSREGLTATASRGVTRKGRQTKKHRWISLSDSLLLKSKDR